MAHTIDTLKLFDDLKESFTEEQAHKMIAALEQAKAHLIADACAA